MLRPNNLTIQWVFSLRRLTLVTVRNFPSVQVCSGIGGASSFGLLSVPHTKGSYIQFHKFFNLSTDASIPLQFHRQILEWEIETVKPMDGLMFASLELVLLGAWHWSLWLTWTASHIYLSYKRVKEITFQHLGWLLQPPVVTVGNVKIKVYYLIFISLWKSLSGPAAWRLGVWRVEALHLRVLLNVVHYILSSGTLRIHSCSSLGLQYLCCQLLYPLIPLRNKSMNGYFLVLW